MSQIYALSSVKFPGLKLRLCNKKDKYELCKLVQSEPFNRHVSFFVISGFLDKSIYDMKVLNFPRKELSKSVQIDESLCCVCIIKQLRKEHSAAPID